MRYFSGTESGFELVEVVIATGILSLTLLSVVAVAGRSVIVAHRALLSYQASTLLEEGAEAARIVRDGSWAAIASLTPNTPYYPSFDAVSHIWTLSPTPNTDGIFTRSLAVSPVARDTSGAIVRSGGADDSGTKLVTETVSWHESDGTVRSEQLSFYLADIF